MIVDSTPMTLGPPSTMRSTSCPRSDLTCSAFVGLTRPKRLALGAAIGLPSASTTRRKKSCAGTRTTTEDRPPVTRGSRESDRGTRSDSGPGQTSSASLRARGETFSPTLSRIAEDAPCVMSGWSNGRPFTSKTLRSPVGDVTEAPRPYTVSVGNATTPPLPRISVDARMASSSRWEITRALTAVA